MISACVVTGSVVIAVSVFVVVVVFFVLVTAVEVVVLDWIDVVWVVDVVILVHISSLPFSAVLFVLAPKRPAQHTINIVAKVTNIVAPNIRGLRSFAFEFLIGYYLHFFEPTLY